MFPLLSRLQSSHWVSHYLNVFFSNVIPHHGLLTPQIPARKPHSSLYPVGLSHRILATDIGKEGSRRGAQTRASEANKSRRLVVTSISIFKYLTEQISGCLRDDSCCSEIPFLAAGRQPASMPIFWWGNLSDFCLSKTLAPVPDAAADKLNRSAKASGSVFPAPVDEAERSSDYLPSVLMAAWTWTQHYHHNYF